MSPTPAQRAQAAAIAAAIAEIGFVLPGTLTERPMRCGHRNCRCHADPPALHGPYHQWTRKVAGKTVTRFLSDDQLADYSDWFDNQHRLRQLIGQLEALSLAIVEADPRGKKKPKTTPVKPGIPSHNTVGAARLTCGPAPDHHPISPGHAQT